MIIVAVGFEVFDEFVDSGVGVGEGVGEFDDLGFGLVDFESEPVDGEGGVVVGGVVEEGAAEGGSGGWWWVGGGVGDGFGGGDAVDAVFGFEESVEAAAGADVVVGEVELVEFGVVVVVGFEAECGVVVRRLSLMAQSMSWSMVVMSPVLMALRVVRQRLMVWVSSVLVVPPVSSRRVSHSVAASR